MQRSREMAVSHADFLRLLPHAMPGYELSSDEDRIIATAGNKKVEIRLGPESERRIAMLRVPVTEVTLVFKGFTDEEARAFLDKFDMTYRRGGG
ncbi:MAG: hypothetical protein WD572_08085 [Gammaproteobacteria bacterium]